MLAKKFLFSVLIVLFGVIVVSAAVPNPGHSPSEIDWSQGISGSLGIGTADPENSAGWGRVLDVKGTSTSKSIVRTDSVNGGVYAHSNGFFGSPSGIIVGSQSNHNVSIVTNSRNAITISEIGRVGIGITNPGSYQLYSYAGAGENAVRGYASADGYWGGYFTGTTHGLHAQGSTYGADVYSSGNGGGNIGLMVRNIDTAPEQDVTKSRVDLGLGDYAIYSRTGRNYFAGNVGIGTNAPSTMLDVNGQIRIRGGSPGAGKVLTSDANGLATWVSPSTTTSLPWTSVTGKPADFADGVDNVGVDGAGEGGYIAKYLGSAGSTLITKSSIVESSFGRVGIGTATPENSEGWGTVLDLYNGATTKLSLRTNGIDGRVLVHNNGWYGSSQPGMYIGTSSNHRLVLATNGQRRINIQPDGNIAILGPITMAPGITIRLAINTAPPYGCDANHLGELYFDNSQGNWAVPCACIYHGDENRYVWKPIDNFGAAECS